LSSAEEEQTTGSSSGNNSDASPSSPMDVSSEFTVPNAPSPFRQDWNFTKQQQIQFPVPQIPAPFPTTTTTTTTTTTITITPPPLPSFFIPQTPVHDLNLEHHQQQTVQPQLKRKASVVFQDPQDVVMWNNNYLNGNNNINGNFSSNNNSGSISPTKKRALSPIDIVVSAPTTPQNMSSPPTSPSHSAGGMNEDSIGNQSAKMSVSFLLN